MTIGTSNGQQFDTWSDYALGQNSYHQENKDETGFVLDQDHNVPLVASALMNDEGSMYGMAVDHRLNPSQDDLDLLRLHESTELPYMNDLVKGGMSAPEAYAVSHKWATARETAASIAKWGQDGHEAYQQRMRDNASLASEPSDRERHPDAHTTKYGLDESELAYEAQQPSPPLVPDPSDMEDAARWEKFIDQRFPNRKKDLK